MNNRRDWLKLTVLGTLGVGIIPIETFAKPITNKFTHLLDNRINLRSNENPYGPSKLAKDAMIENVNVSNRYGWNITYQLISELAMKNDVSQNNILLGAGSTELLDLVFQYASQNEGSYILADTTYDYWTSSKTSNFQEIRVPLTKDKKHNLSAMVKKVRPDTKLIYICNPNNPTGTIISKKDLVSFIGNVPKETLILVDEAYINFSNQDSLSDLTVNNENLVVAKTFSKLYGLAGARVGYITASENTIQKFKKLQSWPNGSLSVVSMAGALASLNDEKFKNEVRTLNSKTKEFTVNELKKLNIPSIPSFSNFLYFSLENYKKDFFKQLEMHNIVGTKIYEENGKWSRITIGTLEEMKSFIKAIA